MSRVGKLQKMFSQGEKFQKDFSGDIPSVSRKLEFTNSRIFFVHFKNFRRLQRCYEQHRMESANGMSVTPIETSKGDKKSIGMKHEHFV